MRDPIPVVSCLLISVLWLAFTGRTWGSQHDVARPASTNRFGSARQLLAEARAQGKVIVVNDIAGHFEVLAGVLHVLQDMGIKPQTLYVGAPSIPVTWGILPWLGETPGKAWYSLPSLSRDPTSQPDGRKQGPESTTEVLHFDSSVTEWWPMMLFDQQKPPSFASDLVLCVSAELMPDVCRSVVNQARPKRLVIILHRADALSPKVLTIHPDQTSFFALAPHVASMSEGKLKVPVSWVLPTAPHAPKTGTCMSKACLDGFAVQGALRRFRNRHVSGFTRNYTQLWERLVDLRPVHTARGAAPVRVTVLGKGERASLMIPAEIDDDVAFYSKLPYPDFWARIHHSLALVPSLGHQEYYLSRITSTVLASLITTTPMIVDQRLFDAYKLFDEEHVFLRQPEEDEAAAMYRIASLPENEIIAKRRALGQLRQEFNKRTATFLTTLLEAARNT